MRELFIMLSVVPESLRFNFKSLCDKLHCILLIALRSCFWRHMCIHTFSDIIARMAKNQFNNCSVNVCVIQFSSSSVSAVMLQVQSLLPIVLRNIQYFYTATCLHLSSQLLSVHTTAFVCYQIT